MSMKKVGKGTGTKPVEGIPAPEARPSTKALAREGGSGAPVWARIWEREGEGEAGSERKTERAQR